MRLAAQVKGGFYPASPAAIEDLADCLKLAEGGETFTLLDPCAGKGAAVAQLAGLLSIEEKHVHAIELDEKRSQELRALMPQAKVLGGTDFLGTEISLNSFSLCWCNPPFDDELGGGARVEYRFLSKATQLLVSQGIMVLVCPEHVTENRDVRMFLLTWFRDVTIVPFPEDHRPFGEVAVFGIKRSSPIEGAKLVDSWNSHVLPNRMQYTVPPAGGPKKWKKAAFTSTELAIAMANSRLKRVMRAPPPMKVPSPGLQLSHGQRALVLAGGFLNRVLQKDGEPPIVIKANPYKEEYTKSVTEEEDDAGNNKTIRIIGQKILLRVRVLTPDGIIHDLK